MRSYLGIPIVTYDGTPIGALGVSSRKLQAFNNRDRDFLISVGAQVSLGVQNAQLFARATDQVQYLALLKAGHANAKLYVGGWSEWGNTAELPLGTQQ